MLQILPIFLYMSGDNTKQAVFGPVAVHGCLEILSVNAVLHNLSEEVRCFWEVLGRVFVCYLLSLYLWGRINFKALLNTSCVFCV